jgi:DNA-binding transcriptional MerR regulator
VAEAIDRLDAADRLRVGELARLTGVSVRTLHHYDQIGLLSPRLRTESGHRLYTRSDVERLQQILSLRQVGLPLDEIGRLLGQPNGSLRRTLALHLEVMRERVEAGRRLCVRLEALVERLEAAGDVPIRDLINTMEAMSVVDRYYTPEQMEQLSRREAEVGGERIRQAEGEWAELQAAVRDEMAKGTDPASEQVRALARKWSSLVREFTGGDPGIHRSLQRMWEGETEIQGIDTTEIKRMMEYLGRAMEADREA